MGLITTGFWNAEAGGTPPPSGFITGEVAYASFLLSVLNNFAPGTPTFQFSSSELIFSPTLVYPPGAPSHRAQNFGTVYQASDTGNVSDLWYSVRIPQTLRSFSPFESDYWGNGQAISATADVTRSNDLAQVNAGQCDIYGPYFDINGFAIYWLHIPIFILDATNPSTFGLSVTINLGWWVDDTQIATDALWITASGHIYPTNVYDVYYYTDGSISSNIPIGDVTSFLHVGTDIISTTLSIPYSRVALILQTMTWGSSTPILTSPRQTAIQTNPTTDFKPILHDSTDFYAGTDQITQFTSIYFGVVDVCESLWCPGKFYSAPNTTVPPTVWTMTTHMINGFSPAISGIQLLLG